MSTPSSSPQGSNSASALKRRRTQNVIGAVAGAVIGGVLGALAVKKVRDGSAKRLIPAKAPALAKRAAGAVKNFAHDAKVVAKATAAVAADAALHQVSNAATQFMVDVASGQKPKLPQPAAATPPATDASTTATSEAAPKKAAASSAGAKKKPAAPKKSPAAKKPAKAATPAPAPRSDKS